MENSSQKTLLYSALKLCLRKSLKMRYITFKPYIRSDQIKYDAVKNKVLMGYVRNGDGTIVNVLDGISDENSGEDILSEENSLIYQNLIVEIMSKVDLSPPPSLRKFKKQKVVGMNFFP